MTQIQTNPLQKYKLPFTSCCEVFPFQSITVDNDDKFVGEHYSAKYTLRCAHQDSAMLVLLCYI